ncbi:type III secretion system translocon subunit SctB [Vibrio sagamiensis]|nr:type III secretion system translocon subunit SctB [Vibrio sagamiensis]PNQ54561.1 hypothetical protein C1141_15225 [Vibrio agarivorans]
MINNIDTKAIPDLEKVIADSNAVDTNKVAGINRTPVEAGQLNLQSSLHAKVFERTTAELDQPKSSSSFNDAMQAKIAIKTIEDVSPTLSNFMKLSDGTINGDAAINNQDSAKNIFFDILVIMITIANISRQRESNERQDALQLHINSLEDSRDELRKQATVQTIFAVAQGFMTLASTSLGVWSARQSGKSLKNEIVGNQSLKGQQAQLDAKMDEIKGIKGIEGAKKIRTDLRQEAKGINDQMSAIKADTHLHGRQFEAASSRQQIIKASTDGTGQIMSASMTANSTASQADMKDADIEATRAQSAQQRNNDNLASLESLVAGLMATFRATASETANLNGRILA